MISSKFAKLAPIEVQAEELQREREIANAAKPSRDEVAKIPLK